MSAIAIEVLFIIILILGNGVLAMSELAIVSARKTRLQQMAGRGVAGARTALDLANEPNQFLSTVQIGITLVGIMAGAFGGATIAEQLAGYIDDIPALARYSEAIGVGVVVLGITYLSLILGELVPKRLALNSAEKIASTVARPMRILSRIASPAVRLLSISTETVLRVIGVKPSAEPPVTEEEIRMMIRQGAEAGVFEKAEQGLVENIFRLGDQRLGALMTPRTEIVWLNADGPPDEIRQTVVQSGYSRFPVCEDSLDQVAGIVRTKDILAALLADRPIDLRTLARQVVFVPETMSAMKALEYFKQTGTHLFLIVDEYGGTEGLITHHDVLEAIVGDIALTGKPGEPRAIQREDGSWLLDGTLSVGEVKDTLQVKRLPGEEWEGFHTLAGFILMRIGRIPKVGDYFEWSGLRFEVIAMDGRRIDKVLVAPIKPDGSNRLESSTDL